MSPFVNIIKGDYLQRTRSYAFLITLAISLYVAYTFVPGPDAAYTTVRVGKFIGEYNSAWIGYVTAIMTSVFLSLIGFFLVNNSVKKDIETEVGMIIATTSVSNFSYLISKTIGNFMVLLSIVGVVFLMSVGIFFYRSSGFDFEITSFLLPYFLVTIPSLFVVSSIAVVGEVWLGRRSVLQYIGFFILFNVVIANVQMRVGSDFITWLDPFGVKQVTMGLEKYVQSNFDGQARVTSMGFNFSEKKDVQVFVFNGLDWPIGFLISRLLWIAFGVAVVFLSSPFFHRFDVKEKSKAAKKSKARITENERTTLKTISLSALPPIVTDYSIAAFIKTELLMLYRKGPRWFWLVNIGGMVALIFTPLDVAHQMLLPVLWFLQIGRWSDLTTKEKTSRIHHFTFAAYQPLKRLLPSQLIAGVTLALALSSPLLIRYAFALEFLQVVGIIAGAFFIVLLAACLGVISGGKKLFEVLFFMITYLNLNRVPFADYFGFQTSGYSLLLVISLCSGLAVLCWSARSYEIRHS
jgi:hypothetical protein